MTNRRVLFWGTSAFAVPILERLSSMDGVEIVGVVTRPDAPAGRHGEPASPPIKKAAEAAGIRVLQPVDLKGPAVTGTLDVLAPDVAIVAAYGRIIPAPLLSVPRKGTLNVHPSLLPRYRGPSPIQAAILAGDAETGVSLMLLDDKMDHGPLLSQERVPLAGTERYGELEARLADIGGRMVEENLMTYLDGSLTPTPQDHAKATTCPMLTRESGRIDWTESAEGIERMARAFDPWPGIWTEWTDGKKTQRVKLRQVSVSSGRLDPGVLALEGTELRVGTATTPLAVMELQLEGKKAMSPEELLRGSRTFLSGRFA